MSDNVITEMARQVIAAQTAAMKRGGVLNLWTIYRRPAEYPTKHIARRHEVKRATGRPLVTDDILQTDGDAAGLELLRGALARAGLTRIKRDTTDEPQIVETWV